MEFNPPVYRLPKVHVSLSSVFEVMQRVKSAGYPEILDWGVSSATLEEVFMNLVQDFQAG